MSAYHYKTKDFKAEIFRVDAPDGRWMIVGTHEALPGYLCVRYEKKLPKGATAMSPERAAYRQMIIEENLRGEDAMKARARATRARDEKMYTKPGEDPYFSG